MPDVAAGLIADRRLETARVDRSREILRAPIPGVSDLREGDAAGLSMDCAIAQHDGFGVRLQEMRADCFRETRHFARRGRDGSASHHRAARTPAPGGVGRVFRIAMDKFDLGDLDPENLMRHLRQGRLHALPVGVDADPELEPAVGRHARGRLLMTRHHRNAPTGVDRGAMCALLAIDRKADADETSIRLAALLALPNALKVGRLQRPAQRFGIVAAVEMLFRDVVERHLLRPDEVLHPHVEGLEPGLARDEVEHELKRIADARSRDAAIGKDRTLVGRDRRGAAAIRREIVRAGQDACDLRRLKAG